MKKLLILFILVLTISCTALLEDLTSEQIQGTWNLVSITDVATNKVTEISENNVTTKIFDNRLGTAISFTNPDFNIYYNVLGEDNSIDGTYKTEITRLTLNFFDNKTIVRQIKTISETELILEDTISGKAKTLMFLR